MNELMIREGLLIRKTSNLFAIQVPILVKNCDQLRFYGLDLPRDYLMPLLSSQFSKNLYLQLSLFFHSSSLCSCTNFV